MTTFTVPADGQWHDLPETVQHIIAPNTVEIDDFGMDHRFRVRNLSRAPVDVEFTERRPNAVTPTA